MAELADAPDLGSGGKLCRFESCYPHHLNSLLTSEPPWVGHQQAVFICLEFMRDQGATLYYVNLDIKVQKLQNERGKSRKP